MNFMIHKSCINKGAGRKGGKEGKQIGGVNIMFNLAPSVSLLQQALSSYQEARPLSFGGPNLPPGNKDFTASHDLQPPCNFWSWPQSHPHTTSPCPNTEGGPPCWRLSPEPGPGPSVCKTPSGCACHRQASRAHRCCLVEKGSASC